VRRDNQIVAPMQERKKAMAAMPRIEELETRVPAL
jgi:hypothetical protein